MALEKDEVGTELYEEKYWILKLHINISIKILNISLLFKTQLNYTGLTSPHRKHITSPLLAQQVNAIYRFATIVY
jgi:hypothetical protein